MGGEFRLPLLLVPGPLDASLAPIRYRYIRLRASPTSLPKTPPEGTNQLTLPCNAVNRKGQTTCQFVQRPRQVQCVVGLLHTFTNICLRIIVRVALLGWQLHCHSSHRN
jgi:hypothetical protein